MREPGEVMSAFPRPGRALKAVLALLAVLAVVSAILVNWAPGGPTGQAILMWVAFVPGQPQHVWTFLTSGLITLSIGHAVFSLIGLYFLTPELERKWGAFGLIRFLALSVVMGNVAVLLADLLPVQHRVFHPAMAFGPSAALAATAIAWSKLNATRQIRLMFVLPVSGKTLYWITIAFAVLYVVFGESPAEGAFAPFGGILVGLLFSGSSFRTVYLKTKLFFLRRKAGGGLTVESMLERPSSPRPKRRGGPDLRVVQGGADDDKKPPKDKRYLN